jgi:adenylate cyclase
MDIEIERKWLMSTDSAEKILKDISLPPIEITQAYFCSTCRVRLARGDETTAEVTIKLSNSALSRNEYNYPIPVEDAYEMLERLSCINKLRYNVGNGFTIDEFQGDLSGLYLIEKEYPSEDEAINDEVP